MTAGLWILLIVSIVLIAGGIAMLIYGLHKHEDKGEKTTTNKLLIGVGAGMIIIGVGLIIFFIFKYRSSNKNKIMIDSMPDVEMSNVSSMSYKNEPMGGPMGGQMGGQMGGPMMSYEPQMYPGTPMYNPPTGFYPQGGFYPQSGGYSGPSPMMSQWQ
jgi:hypothetical protein